MALHTPVCTGGRLRLKKGVSLNIVDPSWLKQTEASHFLDGTSVMSSSQNKQSRLLEIIERESHAMFRSSPRSLTQV